ncbi:MAG: methionyl-tRNA formyltransferase [Phycisphaeraceae bacterium]|nr:methionyl-tRNA formyltransferase [Phycisphaeraceae bacterium]
MTDPMRIAFFGSGEFGLPTLRALAKEHTLVGVVTQPDKPAGRGTSLTPTPIGAAASAELPKVPLLKPTRCNAPEAVAEIRNWNADAWVVIAFGQKLGATLLDGIFAINLHASILPRWRGAAPINAAILAGDAHSGNSVITLADRMDAGEVLASSRSAIGPAETAGELHDRLSAEGPELVLRVLLEFRRGTLSRHVQDESLVTLAPKLSRADGYVDFVQGAAVCARRINGLSPWPGVTMTLLGPEGKPIESLKLCRAMVQSGASRSESRDVTPVDRCAVEPGLILDPESGVVACGSGSTVRLIDVQPAGKRIMAWPDFARGRRLSGAERLARPDVGAG